ncbi:MAG: TonB-dependent receptor [Acidobacteriaceae bacterium]
MDAPLRTSNLYSKSRTLRDMLLALSLLLWLAAALPAAAQAVYGSVFGTVTDTTGAVIPNATITVTDVSKNTSVTAVTNGSGDYTVQHLIPDTYRITAEASGFGKGSVEDVIVHADTSPKVDLQLAVGAVSNTVTVTSAAPLLQTSRADVSTILNSRALSDLPNLQRNFTSFELLTPGTTYIGWNVGPSTNPQQSEQIEVNGQLPFATGYELDGTNNQDPIQGVAVINPNLDAVSEMKVTSQNYNAEFGGAVAGMVTAQTKSGSNAFHGSAFEFRRSDAQQARDPFTQIGPNSIPSFVHNQFGGSIGGPILKDKLFFFGDYQGLREKTGTTIVTTVPTATAHSTCTSGGDCDLSDYLNPTLGGGPQYQAYDPETNASGTAGRATFAGNIIPAGRLSAPSVALMSEMPLPNFGNGSIFNNFAGSGSGGFNTDQFDVRIDDQISQKFHSFGRYTRFNSALVGAPVFGAAGGPGFGLGNFAGTDDAMDQSVAAGGDYALSGKWLTDFRFGWFRINIDEVPPNINQPLGTQLGIPGVNQGDLSITGGLPMFVVSVPANGSNGGADVDYGTTANLYEQTESQYQFVNNWSHFMGNHNIRFGADIRYALNHLVGVNNNNLPSGMFQFPGTVTSGSGSQGLGYATFMLGDVNSFSRTVIQNTNAAERQRRWFFYGQDQWRATQKLTVDYGLRWDLYFPESVAGKGQGGLLDLGSGNVRIAGYGPYNNSLNVNMEYSHVAPRIGLAWQALPDTVVRAGYGRAYGMGWSGDIFGEVLTFSYPTAVTQNNNASSPYTSTFNLSTGPSTFVFPPIPSNGDFPLPDTIQLPTRPLTMRVPTIDAWNFTIQQQLSRSASLQIGYVGSHGVHNMFDSSNQANPNQQTLAGFDCSGAPTGCTVPIDPDTGLPYTTFERLPYYDGTAQRDLGVKFGTPHLWTQSFRYNANQATTKYNALQVVFEKRYSQGFQILSHYTWSQARANESDYFFMDSRADYGNSYYNRRNVFVLTGNWDLPFGKQKAIGGNVPGWVNNVIGGFTLNGTETLESGISFTPSYSLCAQDQDIDGQGGTLCRPNGIGNGPTASMHKGPFDPVSHSVSYFKPVPTLAFAGDVEGPYSRPNPGTFGDMQRGSLWGPGLANTDLAVGKKFFFTEKTDLQLQAQAFNLFNHPNLGNPNNCVDCGSSSGLITDIVASQEGTTMRRLQFAARFQF